MSFSQQIKAARARRASKEIAPPSAGEISYPEGTRRADVLFVLSSPPAPGWWRTQGKFCVDTLSASGITAACTTLPPEGRLRAIIEDLQPRIIVNRSLLIDSETTARLAEDYPEIKFIAVNHSSTSFLIASPREWGLHWGPFWQLMEERPNCFIASPDERNFLSQVCPNLAGKIVWVPNPVSIADTDSEPRPLGDPPLVSIIAAGRPLKNLPNQIVAYALARQEREMRLLISCRNYEDKLRVMCNSLGIEAEISPWLDREEYLDRLRSVDVCLQVSFTESFNYVALEHMLCGVPVVGSSAIRYLPKSWQASIDDPREQAYLLLDHIENWDSESRNARGISRKFAEVQNVHFQNAFARLLET